MPHFKGKKITEKGENMTITLFRYFFTVAYMVNRYFCVVRKT